MVVASVAEEHGLLAGGAPPNNHFRRAYQHPRRQDLGWDRSTYPAFRNTVLPGALDGGLHGRDLQGAKGSGYFQTIFLVVIEEQDAGSGLVRKGFS